MSIGGFEQTEWSPCMFVYKCKLFDLPYRLRGAGAGPTTPMPPSIPLEHRNSIVMCSIEQNEWSWPKSAYAETHAVTFLFLTSWPDECLFNSNERQGRGGKTRRVSFEEKPRVTGRTAGCACISLSRQAKKCIGSGEKRRLDIINKQREHWASAASTSLSVSSTRVLSVVSSKAGCRLV